MSRIRNWTKLSAEELFHEFTKDFIDEEDAVAHAVWVGNRLVRDKEKSSKKKFYSLKDAWLKRHQDCLLEGRIARRESAVCWTCEGTGFGEEQECPSCNGDGENFSERNWEYRECRHCGGGGILNEDGKCSSCSGTGKYRTWELYEHHLLVSNQRYTFHSYVKPKQLSDEPGADCEKYGGRFSEEELAKLALPFSGILKLLGYVAAVKWKLSIDKRTGKYV